MIRILGNFELAEDAVQEAFTEALRSWPTRGVPTNPAAWITTTARNRAIDRLRRERNLREKAATLARLAELEALGGDEDDVSGIPDDRLRLIFTCCHPALSLEARIVLTLRTLGGLTTSEIARTFMVAQPTMAKRIALTTPRTRAIIDLCEEAIRLARIVLDLMPAEADAAGLLALMLLHHSRRETRVSPEGELVLLEEQDRSRWDHDLIDEGLAVLDRALGAGTPGPFQVQGAIAALHARAPRPEDTDWAQIAGLYAVLYRMQPSPVVELNRIVALAMADGPITALPLLDALEERLNRYHLFHSTKADFLRRLDRFEDAVASYHHALDLATSPHERKFLERRIAEVNSRA